MKEKWNQIAVVALIVAAVAFYGPWILNLFGVIDYAIPMSQDSEEIIQIDLLDTSNDDPHVLLSLTGEEITLFMEDFLRLKSGRYANDPPTNFGNRTVRILYRDGGYDLLGDMILFFSATGEAIRTGGWYYLHESDLEFLFNAYLP